jgi:hypothetical protein
MKEWVMVLTENKPNVQELLNVPYVELSFGVIGETLPADHGYGLYSAIALPSLRASLKSPSMPQGVEHYARIRTLFQSLNLRCRKALIRYSCFKVILKMILTMYARREHFYITNLIVPR